MRETFKRSVKMKMPEEDQKKFNSAKKFWICEKSFIFKIENVPAFDEECIVNNQPSLVEVCKQYIKVRDHCQITSQYRGAMHVVCDQSTRHIFQFSTNCFPQSK